MADANRIVLRLTTKTSTGGERTAHFDFLHWAVFMDDDEYDSGRKAVFDALTKAELVYQTDEKMSEATPLIDVTADVIELQPEPIEESDA